MDISVRPIVCRIHDLVLDLEGDEVCQVQGAAEDKQGGGSGRCASVRSFSPTSYSVRSKITGISSSLVFAPAKMVRAADDCVKASKNPERCC